VNVDGAVDSWPGMRTDIAHSDAGEQAGYGKPMPTSVDHQWRRFNPGAPVLRAANNVVRRRRFGHPVSALGPRAHWATAWVHSAGSRNASGTGMTSYTYPQGFNGSGFRANPCCAGVVMGTALAGHSSLTGRDGSFRSPTARLSAGWPAAAARLGTGHVVALSRVVLSRRAGAQRRDGAQRGPDYDREGMI